MRIGKLGNARAVDGLQQPGAVEGMLLDQLVFLVGQPRLFAQDIARHVALANIVKQRAHDEILQLQAGAVILELLV